MPKDLVFDLLDDPVCRLMMESDHVSLNDELSFLKSIKPLFSFDDEMRQSVNHDQRRWVSDRRRNQEWHLEGGESDRRRVSDRRQRPVLAQGAPQYWLH